MPWWPCSKRCQPLAILAFILQPRMIGQTADDMMPGMVPLHSQCATDIASREGATLFIPVSSPIASLYDAMAAEALPEGCRWGLQLVQQEA